MAFTYLNFAVMGGVERIHDFIDVCFNMSLDVLLNEEGRSTDDRCKPLQ